jgi:AcrR family transcriptional regulator
MEDKKRIYLGKISRLYKDHGIKTLTMEAVAKHVGLSKKSLYNYFHSKEQMVDALFQYHFAKNREAFSTLARENRNAIEKLVKVTELLYLFFQEFSQPMLRDLRNLYPYLSHRNKNAFQEHLTKEIANNINKGIQEGLYVNSFNVSLITHYFVFSLKHLLTNDFLTEKETTPSILYKQLIIYHIRGMASEKGRRCLAEHLATSPAPESSSPKTA